VIINVRAPCGGGKSTLVRAVKNTFENVSVIKDGKRTLGYGLSDHNRRHTRGYDLVILGSYAMEGMGGTDSIKDLKEVYALALKYAKMGIHVLFEGHADNDRTNGMLDLWFKSDYRDINVVFLDTHVQECEFQFRQRYNKGGVREGRTLSELTLERAVRKLHKKMQTDYHRMQIFMGHERVHMVSREDGLQLVLKMVHA
jgi:hypothetical protein